MDRVANPEMLILAREARALSQSELAAAVSVTQGKISKYENGMLEMSADDIRKLSKILGYTEEFFFQRHKVYGLGSSFLFHRQRKTAPVLIQRKVQAEINILRIQIARLLRVVEIDAENQFSPLDIDEHDGDVEQVANLVRAAWRLPMGPVQNVTAAIESAGGIVLQCGFDTPLIDAAHLWLPDMPPLFFINRDIPADRARWTLAHEIGHAIMHRNPTGDVEDQANRFASEFLMPREEIKPHLKGMSLNAAAKLKPIWKVSMAAIVRRAFDLGDISQATYRRLNTSLIAEGYRIHEPFPLPPEEPRVVRDMIETHRTELGYNDFDLAKLLFSDDPQYFAPGTRPTILKINNEPFFSFVRLKQSRRVM